MIADTSVVRNFAIAGWADHLRDLGGGVIRVAHGVLGVGPEEPGELDRAREFFERQMTRHPSGSPDYMRALVAESGLSQLIARRPVDLEVVVPNREELQTAIRLQDPDARAWRRGLGMKSRRLDTGEAVSVAIAVARGEPLACDDEDGQIAYRALGGCECLSTLDLVKRAVQAGLVGHNEARAGYERLRTEFRFFGPAWR